MTSKLFSHTGIEFEVAQGVLGTLIAHQTAVIANEHGKPNPDDSVLVNAEKQKHALRVLRDDLDPQDASAIATIIEQYGPQARTITAP